jgi:EAL domain-containing protein (putative c-di-GMP-specific phosphodiesterase class I)/GGDEF domain-containing protein
VPFHRLSGSTFEYMQQNVTIYPLDQEQQLAILFIQDQTALREALQKIQHYAHLEEEHKRLIFDSLTDLHNRSFMLKEVAGLDAPILTILNLDILQDVHKFYGFATGDWLLKAVAARLAAFFHGEMFGVYKLADAEFGVLAKGGQTIEEVVETAEEFLQYIAQEQFVFNENEFPVSFTVGISQQKDKLLRQADLALQAANQRQKSLMVFDASMDNQQQFEENLRWLKILQAALRDGRVVAFFQPIVRNSDNRIVKYELLVRLIAPDGKVISPFFFLEVAKKAKLYHHITRIMVEKAFAICDDNTYDFSINLSVEDILEQDTTALIIRKLAEHPRASKRIVFEIIESEGIENFSEVSNFIRQVKLLGAKIAIDDFGTGYSNFDYLLRLDIDYIKIDGSLIKNLDVNVNSRMVVETIVDFAKKLGMETVGEYVESEELLVLVKRLGVTYSQGYLLGKPEATVQAEDQPVEDKQGLNSDQLDALREMINIAFGAATSIIADIMHSFADLRVPVVEVMNPPKLQRFIGRTVQGNLDYLVTTHELITPIEGEALFLIDKVSATNLARYMPAGGGDTSDSAVRETVLEVADIVISSCLQNFAPDLNCHTELAAPSLAITLGAELVGAEQFQKYDRIILIESVMHFEKEQIQGQILILTRSEEWLRQSLDAFIESLA